MTENSLDQKRIAGFFGELCCDMVAKIVETEFHRDLGEPLAFDPSLVKIEIRLACLRIREIGRASCRERV